MSDVLSVFIFLWWIVGCIFVANAGSKRTIGGVWAFVAAFFFSPLFGALVVMLSKDEQTQKFELHVYNYLKNISASINGEKLPPPPDEV